MIGINASYNHYVYRSIRQTNATSEKAQKNDRDYLKEFKEKYPSLKFSIGYNTKGPTGTGLGNVVLQPQTIKEDGK